MALYDTLKDFIIKEIKEQKIQKIYLGDKIGMNPVIFYNFNNGTKINSKSFCDMIEALGYTLQIVPKK